MQDPDVKTWGPSLWLMEGSSLDVSLAFLDIFMVALPLSGSLVSGGRQGASPPGQSEELDLVLVQNWWGIPHLHAEWLRGEVSGASFFCPCCISCFSSAIALLRSTLCCSLCPPAQASLSPVPFSVPRAASSLFLLWFSATLGVPVS